MPECDNPLWPCAMTGAASCLAGFEGLTVVIHGSSGCYYYPTTLLHAPLEGTFILEQEVIFGAEDRLREVVARLSDSGKRIAVITTCVPAILGEDIRAMLEEHEVLLVDSPGFSGDIEAGYSRALSMLAPTVDPTTPGVNIDGVCLFDPFHAGNLLEAQRLCARASVPVGTVFSKDRLGHAYHAAPYTIGTNGDFASGIGEPVGGILGFKQIRATFTRIDEVIEGAGSGPVLEELDMQEERVIQACDKFLHRYDPPTAGIFAGCSYARFAADTLERYLDAEICCIGSRNVTDDAPVQMTVTPGLSDVRNLIQTHQPDLVIGSSFERSVSGNAAFVGIIPPLRGKVRLYPAPLAGINGILSFIEQVLNACIDKNI